MVAAFCWYLLVSQLQHVAFSQGTASLIFSENPTYKDNQVTVACIFTDRLLLVNVTMEAFNGTLSKGSLSCSASPKSDTIGTGIFSNSSFVGCPNRIPMFGNVSVPMQVSPVLELEYRCSIKAVENETFHHMSSNRTLLKVQVAPSAPKLIPEHLVFNDSDYVSVVCQSHKGKPAAVLTLTVGTADKSLNETTGVDSVSLNMTVPRSWHNATAVCNVTNHNMITVSSVIVHHIALDSAMPVVVYTDSSIMVLNCSAQIAVFPDATYNWSVPVGIIVNESSILSSPTFTVLPGQWGEFNCMATNTVTRNTVVVTYNVTGMPIGKHLKNSIETSRLIIWALPVFGFTLIIIIVILSVLYKCGHFRKGRKSELPGKPPASLQLNGYGDEGDEIIMTENSIYASSVPRPADDAEGVQNYDKNRLLIAAEGAAVNLKHKILPTTALVEFCDRSCSLDNILDKIGRVSSLPSRATFKSVALLLRPSAAGLTLSEVDRVELNGRSITGKRSETLRTFFTRLADITLDNQMGSTRIDVLNYGCRDAAKLAQELTAVFKVPVTISRDVFGMDTSMPPGGKYTAVGEHYFDRNRLTEVVYAEVEPLIGNPSCRPCRSDDHVIYSELA